MSAPHDSITVLERGALALAERTVRPSPTPAEPASRAELVRRMAREERLFILSGALAGALSGLVAVLGVVTAEHFWGSVELGVDLWGTAAFYGVALSIAVVGTALELSFLFVQGLRTATRLGVICGSVMHPDPEARQAVRLDLVRAGLEIPPSRAPAFGIDPLLEHSRLRLMLFTLAYKLKVLVSGQVAKALARRIFARLAGRAMGRAAVEGLGIPIFAAWNTFVCIRVMRQARVRALAPALVDELFDTVFPDGQEALSDDLRWACFLAVREQVVCEGRFHPAQVWVVRRLKAVAPPDADGRPARLADQLPSLSPADRRRVLWFFAVLCVLDGVLSRRERQRLAWLREHGDLPPDDLDLEAVRQAVLSGRPFEDALPAEARFGPASGGPPAPVARPATDGQGEPVR